MNYTIRVYMYENLTIGRASADIPEPIQLAALIVAVLHARQLTPATNNSVNCYTTWNERPWIDCDSSDHDTKHAEEIALSLLSAVMPRGYGRFTKDETYEAMDRVCRMLQTSVNDCHQRAYSQEHIELDSRLLHIMQHSRSSK